MCTNLDFWKKIFGATLERPQGIGVLDRVHPGPRGNAYPYFQEQPL
jgi:hypothetical protein